MPFILKKTEIPDVLLIEPEIFDDDRGFFEEIYKLSYFKRIGIEDTFCQVNHSSSHKNVLRGLHFQKAPMAQAKIIKVINGEIFDVAVDLRKGSPSYGKWVSVNLSAKNKNMLYIPEGFAHGFFTISDNAEVVYFVSKEYSPEHDSGIIWSDPTINISWPSSNPVVSSKDQDLSSFEDVDPAFIF